MENKETRATVTLTGVETTTYQDGSSKSLDCTPNGMTGDPHVTTVAGEKFDIVVEGQHTLLDLSQESDKLLTVQVALEKKDSASCEDLYINDVFVSGKWLGLSKSLQINAGALHDLDVPLRLRAADGAWQNYEDAGDSITLSPAEGPYPEAVAYKMNLAQDAFHKAGFEVRFDPIKMQVYHAVAEDIAWLDVHLMGLSELDMDIGGLLGFDDHTAAATLPKACQHAGLARTNVHHRGSFMTAE